MKYFLDTEFIEGFNKHRFGKRRHFIDLISIGIVCEDGRTYNAISSEYNYKDADAWVQNNVISPLYRQTVSGDMRNHYGVNTFQKGYGKSLYNISREILSFVANTLGNQDAVAHRIECYPPEFYAYYGDYDWVLFCSLFGRMIDLPKGFPMYCRDIKQMMDEKGVNNEHPDCPKQKGEHDALSDAEWNKAAYQWVITL